MLENKESLEEYSEQRDGLTSLTFMACLIINKWGFHRFKDSSVPLEQGCLVEDFTSLLVHIYSKDVNLQEIRTSKSYGVGMDLEISLAEIFRDLPLSNLSSPTNRWFNFLDFWSFIPVPFPTKTRKQRDSLLR